MIFYYLFKDALKKTLETATALFLTTFPINKVWLRSHANMEIPIQWIITDFVSFVFSTAVFAVFAITIPIILALIL